jgi:hypothetical protein
MDSPLVAVERFEEITAAWLTSALRQGGVLRNATVESVDTHVVGLSAGYISEVARLTPHYSVDEQGAPESIIAKLPSLDVATQAWATSLHYYERESRFYQEIGPEAGMRVPACYFSAMDLAQTRHVLLLEDIGPVGLGSQSSECTVDEARRALEALAGMHARWWESEQLDKYPWLGSAESHSLDMAYPRKYRTGWGGVKERFSGRLPEGVEEVGDRLVRGLGDIMRRTSVSPVTLVHGSFRPENIYFEEGGEFEGIAAVSWQLAGRWQGALDVAFFIPYALPTNVRREHEESLLRAYLKALTRHGVADYSFEQLVEHYRLGLLRNLVLFVIGDENVDLEVSTGEVWNTRRVASLEALVDWNCAELMAESA